MTDLRAYQLHIDTLLKEGYSVEEIIGFIYGLSIDYKIDEEMEGLLYYYIDPRDEHNTKSPMEYWYDWDGCNNPLNIL